MSGIFYLKCLGRPELLDPDGRPVRLRGHKQLALLAYLAVERRASYRREELTELLWADHPPREARHSLATAISGLRRVLGREVLGSSRDLLTMDQRAVRLDVDRLEAGDLFAAPPLPPVEVDAFLDRTDWRVPLEYQHWRDRQQARWQPHIKAGLHILIDHSRRTGASRQIGRLADQLTALDPLAEEGARAKMEALAFAGDRINALRVFEEWRERLRAELGAEPPAHLEEMAKRLRRRGVERPVADPTPSVPTDSWRDRRFVGRATEHRLLYETWERVTRGTPAHFLVEGESGIGKTTLVERFAMAAALEGAVVARTQCYELERELPFAMLAGLVVGLMDKPGVASTDPGALAEVARVVRKLRDRFPGLPEPIDSHGETARLHFAEGVMAMLEAAMDEHPVILVVDDAHLADEASLTVLHLMLRRLEAGPLLGLLTMRSAELAKESGAARIYEGGERLRMRVMRLPPLSEEEAAELLAGLLPDGGAAPTPAERHALLQAGRGVPMVLQLLVHDWRRHGASSVAFGFRSMTPTIGGWEGPDTEGIYRHLVDRVLADLDPVTRLVMHTASVLGSRVSDLSLYQAADLPTSQTMMGVAALAQRHVLRESERGLQFVNELVRGQAYASMPGALRQELHLAVAQQLLRRHDSGDASVPGLEIAWHLVRGGKGTEAVPHLIRGAREAIRGGAPHEAELALLSALDNHELLKGSSRNTATLLLAEIQQEQSRWVPSLKTLERLEAPLEQEQVEQKRLLTLVADRNAHHLEGRHLSEVIDSLLALARSATQPLVRARAIRVASGVLDQAQSRAYHRKISDAIEAVSAPSYELEEHAELLTAEATLRYHERDLPGATDKLIQALELLESAHIESSTFVNLLVGLSALACASGDYEHAINHGQRGYRHATRIDHERLALRAASNTALALGRLGRYEDQLEWATRKLSHLNHGTFDQERLKTAWMVAMAMAMLGHQGAGDRYREILGELGEGTLPWVKQAALLVEADIRQLMGHKGTALRLARAGTTGNYAKLHSVSMAGHFARWVGGIAAASGEGLTEAQDRLIQVENEYAAFDLLDEAEMVMVRVTLGRLSGEQSPALTSRLAELRSRLPRAVHTQWERLGWRVM